VKGNEMYRITTSTHVTEYHYTVQDFWDRAGIHEDVTGATITVSPEGVTITLVPVQREEGFGPSGSWSA
jgi:hypothetical protein